MVGDPHSNPGLPAGGGEEAPPVEGERGRANLPLAGLTKQCWSCNETTPYEEGWCTGCRDIIPEVAWPIIGLTVAGGPLPPTLSGAVRLAITDWIKAQHRAASRPAYSPRSFGQKTIDRAASGEEVLKLIGLG